LGLLAVRLPLLFGIALIGQGCATSEPGTGQHPPYQERAQTKVQGDLSVTVAVPTAEESKAIYGVDLAEKLIQPVWIEVQNETAVPYWFLISGLDPNYFASSEAAYAFRSASDDANHALDEKFDSLQFKNPIMSGVTASGFVLTNLDEGIKAVDVDLIAREDAKSFTFFTVDPTFESRGVQNNVDELYRNDDLIHVDDEDQLRALLEQLPCCTTNEDGTEYGDPLNLVLIGAKNDLVSALVRRQWHPTEIISAGSIWRTVASFLLGSRYRYSPISPLYIYGRPQDASAQKARSTIHERNHARFWLSPIRFQGKEVWVGQVSRDIGIKFSLESPTIVTHVIDPDVDATRRYFVEDLAYSQALQRIGSVKGVGEASSDTPRTNLSGDPYYTDGLRGVLFFEPRPVSLSELDFLDWESPPGLRHRIERGLYGDPE
jgi:hypothetical protein